MKVWIHTNFHKISLKHNMKWILKWYCVRNILKVSSLPQLAEKGICVFNFMAWINMAPRCYGKYSTVLYWSYYEQYCTELGESNFVVLLFGTITIIFLLCFVVSLLMVFPVSDVYLVLESCLYILKIVYSLCIQYTVNIFM